MAGSLVEGGTSVPERDLLRTWRSAIFAPVGDLPSLEDVRILLEELGIRAGNVHPAARQVRGMAKYGATEICQTGPRARLGIAVYSRDAAHARLLAKAGRFLLYRDSGPSLTLTRLQQVEHEEFVSEADATAAVFIQRLFTSYLPPVWGWFTLIWMRKREYWCPAPHKPR